VGSNIACIAPATMPNARWSMDVMRNSLYDGRRFRVVTFVDAMRRERPYIAVERAFSGARVTEVLEQAAQRSGLPEAIQVDTGPECTTKALDEWAARKKVNRVFRRSGTPTDSPYSEACNGRL
jgi:putative transposase